MNKLLQTSWQVSLVLGRRQILAGYAGATLFTAALLGLLQAAWLSAPSLSWVVVAMAVGKSYYFIWSNQRKIEQVTAEHSPFHHYLVFLLLTASLVVYSFALDSFTLYRLDSHSYAGLSPHFTWAEQLFECYYFSFLNLTIYGAVEVIPKSVPAKMLLMLEEALVFLMIVYILSDFVSLRESIRATQQNEAPPTA